MPLPLALSVAEAFFQMMQPTPRAAPQSRDRKQWVLPLVESFLQRKFHQPHTGHFHQSGSLFGGAFGFAIGAAEPWWLSSKCSA